MSMQQSVHGLYLLMRVSGLSVNFEEATLLYGDIGKAINYQHSESWLVGGGNVI